MEKIEFNDMLIERTVIDKSVAYAPTAEECELIKDKVSQLLTDYEFDVGEKKGIDVMYGQDGIFWHNKGWMIDAFKKHPLYNGHYQIVIPGVQVQRRINKNDAHGFFAWIRRNKSNIVMPEECNEIFDKMDVYRNFFQHFESYIFDPDTKNPSVMDEQITERLNLSAKEMGFKIRFQKDQKISRAISKFCRDIKLDKIVDITDITWYDGSGNEHTRTKDIGWNYQFAMFADAINPLTIEMTAVISCNPLDYYTMSFGDTWSSCHTIDKNGMRNHTNYSGEYCSGVQSYALDESSFIFYYIRNDYSGECVEDADKVKRCVFYLGEDKLIQSRVYPDGRDGGVGSFAEDIRRIVQKVISEIYDVPNLWIYKGGTEEATEMIDTNPNSNHYRDYNHYNDVGVCYMKRVDGYKNTTHIRVGYGNICVDCGEKSSLADDLVCRRCKNKIHKNKKCVACGEMFSREEGRYNSQGEFICDSCGAVCMTCGDWTVANNMIQDYYGNKYCSICGESFVYVPQLDGYFHASSLISTVEGTIWPIGNSGYCYCGSCNQRHDTTATTENNNHVRMCPTCRVA